VKKNVREKDWAKFTSLSSIHSLPLGKIIVYKFTK
jgi:hypothetical protein